jgi:hypothetical protein
MLPTVHGVSSIVRKQRRRCILPVDRWRQNMAERCAPVSELREVVSKFKAEEIYRTGVLHRADSTQRDRCCLWYSARVMVTDLVDRLQAAIDAELKRTDWPHRPTCQMLKPVPPGFPFDCFSCNCDAVDTWMRMHETNRTILDLHEHVPVEEGGIGCVLCAYDTKYGEVINEGYCGTVLALAGAYGITQ